MNGGPTAKNAYRYQDLCAMYVALKEFKNGPSFEHIYCEQGKNDFEIWKTDEFLGFQVKTNPANLTAKEVNKIFKYYNNKSISSTRSKKLFFFIFAMHPVKSLDNLLKIVRDGYGGSVYGKRIQKFINTALQDIPIGVFIIRHLCYDERDIQRLVFSISTEILKEKTGGSRAISDEVAQNFVSRLRDEIDIISCKQNASERLFSNKEIDELIIRFINSYRKEEVVDRKSGGQIKTTIELPKVPYNKVVTKQTIITEIQVINDEMRDNPNQ